MYQEICLRLLGRIWLPQVMVVKGETQLHCPALSEYRHGVKASLSQCLRLQFLDLKELDPENIKIFLNFGWGLD